jgi:hypothetical protein
MNATLMLLALTSTPDAALLEKLGARAQQLEAFANASRVTVDIVAEELDGEGAVKKTTHTALRVGRSGKKVERKLLTYVEDGKDLTEAKRAELEKEPPKKGGAGVQSPFHPEQRTKYQFSLLEPPTEHPGLLRLGFQPSGEKSESLYVGEATVDPETGDVHSLSLKPSKNPSFVDSLSLEGRFDAPTPAGRAMSKLTMKGVAGLLFFKQRFRVVTTFGDYEPL